MKIFWSIFGIAVVALLAHAFLSEPGRQKTGPFNLEFLEKLIGGSSSGGLPEAMEFRGLKLGMSADEVNRLMKTSYWSLEAGSDPIDPRLDKCRVFMKANPQARGDDKLYFLTVGRIGNETVYWEDATVCFHLGRVYKILIMSSPYKKNDIDGVRPWLSMVEQGIIQEYGAPQTVRKPIRDIELEDLKKELLVEHWGKGDRGISLGIFPTDTGVIAAFWYTDNAIRGHVDE